MKCPTCEQPVPPPELSAVNVYCTEVEWELPQYESPSYIGGLRSSRSTDERSFSRCYATGQADGEALGQLVMGDVDLVLMPKAQLVKLVAKADLYDATKIRAKAAEERAMKAERRASDFADEANAFEKKARRCDAAEARARKAECKLGRIAQVLL